MFLVCSIATGVREVSCALANPFGTDEVDFPVQKYIAELRELVSTLSDGVEWQPGIEQLFAKDSTDEPAERAEQQLCEITLRYAPARTCLACTRRFRHARLDTGMDDLRWHVK